MDNNIYLGKEFLSLPKSHHHVSKLLVLVIIMVVIAGLVWGYTYFFMNKPAAPQVVPTNKMVGLTEEQIKAFERSAATASTTVSKMGLTPAQVEKFLSSKPTKSSTATNVTNTNMKGLTQEEINQVVGR